jgi:hypothetical protein
MMGIEGDYRAVLEATHQMLTAVNAQDWNSLAVREGQRAALVAALAPIAAPTPALEPALARRIVAIISEIEDKDHEILEHVDTWQKHVRILLRLDKPIID